MPTFLITVRQAEADDAGLRLYPGIRPSVMKNVPAMGKMTQGSRLELRRPDGTTRSTSLVTFGVSVWKGENGSILLYDDPKDPEICLTIRSELESEEVPAGTEVWLMDDAVV